MEKITIDFESSIGPWIGKTSKIVDYYLHEALQQNGLDLSKEQMIVLKKLHEKDGLNQNELALMVFRDKSSLARLLSKMEKKRYIVREQSKDDRRNNEVYLTPEGRAMFQKTKPVIQSLMKTMENKITEDEKRTLIKILKKVQFNFTEETASL